MPQNYPSPEQVRRMREKEEKELEDRKKEEEKEDPNSVLNVLKRGFLPTAERIDAQRKADQEAKRRKK